MKNGKHEQIEEETGKSKTDKKSMIIFLIENSQFNNISVMYLQIVVVGEADLVAITVGVQLYPYSLPSPSWRGNEGIAVKPFFKQTLTHTQK